MSLPTLNKTWLFSANNSVGGTGTGNGDTSSILSKIVSTLTGFAGGFWTVDYSCSSTVAGTKGDGVNRIGSSAWVWSNGGQNTGVRSWIVLKNSALAGAEILLSTGVGSTTPIQFSMAWSYAGFTGGTTTSDPTATDALWILPAGSYSATYPGTYPQANPSGSTFSGKLHAMMSSDGTCSRVIVCVGGLNRMLFMFEKPSGSPPTAWTTPLIATVVTGTSSVEELTYSLIFRSATGIFTARVGALGPANMYPTCEAVNGSEVGSGQQYANDIDGTYPMLPVGLMCVTGTGVRGRYAAVNDLWAGVANVAEGTNYPGDASKQFVQLGCLIFPWNGTTAQTS